jgi:hypothetical protein
MKGAKSVIRLVAKKKVGLLDEPQGSFFSFIVFGGTEVPIVYIFLCRRQRTAYSEVPSQMAAHLRTAVHCRLGRLLDSNSGLQLYNLVSLPMSHHCSQMSHHCSHNEPPLLPY